MRKLEINERAYSHIIDVLSNQIQTLKLKVKQDVYSFNDSSDFNQISRDVNEALSEIASINSDLEALYSAKYYDDEDV